MGASALRLPVGFRAQERRCRFVRDAPRRSVASLRVADDHWTAAELPRYVNLGQIQGDTP